MVKFNLLEIQEHEQALSDAIARLGDLSDGESGMFFISFMQFLIFATN